MRNFKTMRLVVVLLSLAGGAHAEGEDEDDPGLHGAPDAVVKARPARASAPTPTAAEDPPPAMESGAPAVHHMPVASASADTDLFVTAEVQAAHAFADITLHYRRRGESSFRAAPFRRAVKGFVAAVPAAELAPGVLEYYIATRAVGGAPASKEDLRFASPAAPHPVILVGDAETRWRKELLAAHLGNRSRMQLQTEYVNFGIRLPSSKFQDYYVRIEADYTYRLLGWVYQLRIGGGVLGSFLGAATFASGRNAEGEAELQKVDKVGMKYGFAELRFRFGRLVRADLRATLGAGPVHFDGGAGAQLVIGRDPGTHFALGFDALSTIGTRAFLRLAWNTVPRLPMSLTLEMTNLPANGPIAGRVLFAVEYRVFRHMLLNAQVGYATRDFRIGGPSAGLGTAIEF
ncbi:MAG: hypothetical protein EXR72_03955 [Myxococcales bacterium]|nr:hypothetical protein [Myxococcales bacterium]